MYVLDRNLNPVGVGVPGELYLGGDGVATGYLERPELTAEVFLRDPFAESPGARMYRTGDVVRYRPDGNIEFLGRTDHQVKLRGFRIELGEIESVLNQYDAVSASVVTVHQASDGDRRLVAYVVPEFAVDDAAEVERESGDRVDEWQNVYDDVIYRHIDDQPAAREDSTFNIVGWLSTYTGKALGPRAMREQVDQTVSRMLDGAVDRVLEIGCGTGLLLFPVVPHCREYWATDFSQVALDYIGRQLEANAADRAKVRLLRRLADNFEGVAEKAFELAVLNSVVQYFPTLEYLDEVLAGAVRAVAPGGRVLIGDVRSFPLLETFQTSVQRFQAAADVTVGQLRQRIHQNLLHEQELVVDPEYFVGLQARNPRIRHVEILLKRGHEINELTKYRYDVVLHVESSAPSVVPETWLDWEQVGLEGVQRRLAARPGLPLAIRAVPNGRLSDDLAIAAALAAADPDEPLNRVIPSPRPGADPERLWDLGESSGYAVTLGWSDSGPDGRYDVVFTPRPAAGEPRGIVVTPLTQTATGHRARDLRSCGTNPLRAKTLSRLVPGLRQHIDQHLPEYMMPSAFVLLDSLPLTSNGKVDRRALPQPDSLRPELSNAYEAPRTAVEEALCGIWSALLGVERIGIRDGFFELGGHSLLATQIMSRIREQLGCELPIRDLFDNPTVAGLAGVVQRASVAALKSEPIGKCPREGDLPLSFAQQRLWFLEQLNPGSTGYNSTITLRLRGTLDATALRGSLDEVVRRHEVLRTAFRSKEGVPYQVVLDWTPAAFEIVDLTGDAEETRENTALRCACEELERPFDLSAGQPLRARLIRLAADHHVLLLTVHHIVFDGWSIGVLYRELSELYASRMRGEAAQLPPLAIQYPDFAAWQRQWLTGPVWESQASYWRAQLANVTPLDLPTDRPRPARQSFWAARRRLVLPQRLAAAIDRLGLQLDATPFMILFAAINALLRRYSGQDDIVVGSPVANRNRIETEQLIGFFVNSLVLRTDLSGNPTFRELVRRVRTIALAAYEHQDIPFEHLVEELRPERDLSRNPIFQIMFAVHESQSEDLQLPGVDVTPFERAQATTRLDLEVHVFRSAEGATVYFVYNTDLFDPITIERMARHYERLLEGIVANPDRAIGELQILDDAERGEVLVEWNDTRRDFPLERRLHQQIERQAARTPDATAVVFGDRTLTYQQLDARANQVAHTLLGMGVSVEALVGLCVERSPEMVVGLLGILKAGAAYVPLDPEYPRQRLEFMLADSGVSVLLTQRSLRESLPEHPLDVLCLDGESAIDGSCSTNPSPLGTADNLAYVIYTSGSTGQPKGVCLTHQGLANYIAWCSEAYAMRPGQVSLVHSSIAFDLTVTSLLAPLSVGATVHLVPEAPGVDALADAIRGAERVDVIKITPSHLQLLSQVLTAEERGRVGTLVVGGEDLKAEDVALWGSPAGSRLWNEYGPTETVVGACVHLVEQDATRSGSIPIGRPIANTRLYVLDRALDPVPIGVPGELYIGGIGVARGYHRRPALTAELFVPDPFGDQPGARLYRTGDLARYRSDGNLEFLGRIDHQVKLRGYRIELGEIESVLEQHEGVDHAVAWVREDRPGDRRLVAYLVLDSQREKPDLDERQIEAALQGWLSDRLPRYMVPSAFVILESLPLTTSGKVDLKALPVPDRRTPPAQDPAGARTPTERVIVGIWQQVLRLNGLGVHDDFFALGGHSLLATQVLSRIERELDIRVPLSRFFQFPTVASMADHVDRTVHVRSVSTTERKARETGEI
jgi:amino acid adenylation domain-containing protein